MKVNTDGVLLAALTEGQSPARVLDIGTGTGVIALMIAQRFSSASVDAVEMDPDAAATALKNFAASPFADRLHLYEGSFQEYGENEMKVLPKYDLIVSNPPYFLNSLRSPDGKKGMARHAEASFFSDLMNFAAENLTEGGFLTLILPLSTSALIGKMALSEDLYPLYEIIISSYANTKPVRKIISFGRTKKAFFSRNFVIYQRERHYSPEYQQALRDFFIIF